MTASVSQPTGSRPPRSARVSPPPDPARPGGIGLGVVPRQRRGVEVRERLYDAAIAEFAAHGLDDSRVERIVAAAGTSWGTFFRYFPRKEDVLLHAAARHVHERVRPALERGLADPARPAREVTWDVFVALLQPALPPRLHAEVLAETQRNPRRFAALLGAGEVPLVAMVAQAIRTGQQRGELRPDPPALVGAIVLTAGVVFTAAQALPAVAAGELPPERLLEVAAQAFGAAWDGIGAPG